MNPDVKNRIVKALLSDASRLEKTAMTGNHRLWKAKYIEDRDTIDGYLLTEADLRAIPQIGEPVSAATVVEKNGRPRGTFFW